MATMNWRTINVDLLDPESPANFDTSSLLPSIPSVSASQVQTLSSQIKQLLRGGDSESALRGALENVPYGGDAQAKVSNALLFEASRCSGDQEIFDLKECIQNRSGLLILRTGCTSSHGSGNAAIDQAIRDVAHTKQDIQLRRWS